MNEEQKNEVQRFIEAHKQDVRLFKDQRFVQGIYEALEAIARGEKGIPGKDVKRKYKRA